MSEEAASSCQLLNYILSSVTELVEHISYLIKLDDISYLIKLEKQGSRELVSTA